MQRGGKNESNADARYWKTAAVAKHYVGYSLDCVDPAHPHVGCTEIPDRRWHPWVAGDRHHFNANISTVPCTIDLSRTRFCSVPFTPNS